MTAVQSSKRHEQTGRGSALIISPSLYNGKTSKPPNSKSAKVTFEDIKTLKNSTITSDSNPSLVSDKKLNGTLRKKLSKNTELIDFTGIKTSDLLKTYVNSTHIGKSLDKYNVYYVNFESEKWGIISTYDIDRDLLIGAVFFDYADENNVKVTDRNIGVIFEGTLAEVMMLKNDSAEDVAMIKAKQKNPYAYCAAAGSLY